jgi:16S rRNA pseudouridine516 synthase
MMKMKPMRLDKLLGHMGYGSRNEIRVMVRQGAAKVNGRPVKDSGLRVTPGQDVIEWFDEVVRYREFVYILMHKPAGVISATEDFRERTVIDLLDDGLEAFEPFPVGRLDKDTEGLLLLTNDGKLAHELLSPRKHVPKTYRALVKGDVDDQIANQFRLGVTLDDGYVTMPASLAVLAAAPISEAAGHPVLAEPYARMGAIRGRGTDEKANERCSWIELTIHEGKFHQVKRMFEAVGRHVMYLRRIAMGPLQLDPALAPGQWRELTETELAVLKQYRKDESV